MTATVGERGDAITPSAVKALICLQSLQQLDASAGLSVIARRTGLAKSTTYRMLSFLEEFGFVTREGTNYRLAGGSPTAGTHTGSFTERMRVVALPHLSVLYVKTGRPVQFGVLDGVRVRYVEAIGREAHLDSAAAGSTGSVTCTALGKALLAFGAPSDVDAVLGQRAQLCGLAERTKLIEDLRASTTRGFTVGRQGGPNGLASMAAPVLVHGHAVAAVGLIDQCGRMTFNRWAPLLRQACARIALEFAADPDLVQSA